MISSLRRATLRRTGRDVGVSRVTFGGGLVSRLLLPVHVLRHLEPPQEVRAGVLLADRVAALRVTLHAELASIVPRPLGVGNVLLRDAHVFVGRLHDDRDVARVAEEAALVPDENRPEPRHGFWVLRHARAVAHAHNRERRLVAHADQPRHLEDVVGHMDVLKRHTQGVHQPAPGVLDALVLEAGVDAVGVRLLAGEVVVVDVAEGDDALRRSERFVEVEVRLRHVRIVVGHLFVWVDFQ
mmetsp:Transcript_8137/g.25377  ORF Transcript_8137/g.25377 Transcript_8137/m.25377 type:complete len:240 (-) Transcript_8137:17-736(-)